MYITHIDIHIKPEFLDAFRAATIDNASNSVKEAGIARFDFIQQNDDPTRFMLVEVYRTRADADLHKQTAHYARWRDTVADMFVEPRTRIEYTNILPDDNGWD